MRTVLHKITALILAAVLLTATVSAAVLGSSLRQDSLELSATATLTHGQLTGSSAGGGQQTENILEYTPDSNVRPMVAYGSMLYGRSDAQYVADYLRTRGYTPVAAVNGGFFTMSTGVPMDLVLTDGVVRSSGDNEAVGFRADGSAIIGQPNLQIQVTYPNGQVGSALYNKTLTTGNGAILYSRDFDVATRNTISAYNVVLSVSSEQLVPGQTITATVTAVTPDTDSCDIPAGSMVLAMATETDYQYTFDRQVGALQVGDTVTIDCTVDEQWSDVLYALGGDEMLVVDGVAQTEFVLNTAERRAARTAVGLKADGTLVLYTVDGAQSGYSAGLTLAELAERMVELGCVTALNLDGGGSTTYVAQYPGDSTLTTVNRPSDGKLRKCANFIFLAAVTAAPGEATALHLYPYDGAVLSGGRLNLTVKATDDHANAVEVPADLAFTATGGTVDESGVFTAGPETTTAVVQVTGGSASGSRAIRVVETPSSISVRNEASGQTITALTAAAGETVQLTAAAAFYGYNLTAQDDCFTWSVSEGIGTVDETGAFTAAPLTSAATGTLTCSAGGTSASIQITVTPLAPEGSVLLGFERGEAVFTSGTGLELAANSDLNFVRYGRGSLRASYDLSQVDAAADARRQVTADVAVTLPAGTDHVGLWVYGDGSGNSLSLRFTDGSTVSSLWLTQLNFSGWRYVTAEIPAGATALSGVAVTEYETAAAASGTVYLDQLVATSGELTDSEAPSLTVSRSDAALEIAVADTGSGVSGLTVTVDGQEQAAELAGGLARVALPTDGLAHQVRVTVWDNFGNLVSETVDISGTLENPFTDLDNHWARVYVDYCYREGILGGSADAEGNLSYRPDDPMRRQEFASAIVRFLGVDTSSYASVVLPFADSEEIADWALNDVKAAYALGLFTGSSTGGALYANPTDTISRQEAMTILGRTQDKGYAEDDLSSFPDGQETASWARSYIGSMVTRGIISGSNGYLRPTGTVTRGQVAKMLYSLY